MTRQEYDKKKRENIKKRMIAYYRIFTHFF